MKSPRHSKAGEHLLLALALCLQREWAVGLGEHGSKLLQSWAARRAKKGKEG